MTPFGCEEYAEREKPCQDLRAGRALVFGALTSLVGSRPSGAQGSMFWLSRKKFVGS